MLVFSIFTPHFWCASIAGALFYSPHHLWASFFCLYIRVLYWLSYILSLWLCFMKVVVYSVGKCGRTCGQNLSLSLYVCFSFVLFMKWIWIVFVSLFVSVYMVCTESLHWWWYFVSIVSFVSYGVDEFIIDIMGKW